MKDLKFAPGTWYAVHTTENGRGIRNKNGLICILTMPSKYPGQEDRYQKELQEVKDNEILIFKAPEMYEALKQAKEALDRSRVSWRRKLDDANEALETINKLGI